MKHTTTTRARDALRHVALAALALMVASGSLAASGADRANAQDSTDPVLTPALGLSDPIVGTDISRLPPSSGPQYRNNNQRNYWWNAQAARWDGFLPTASPPAALASQWWLWHDLGGAPAPVTASDPDTAKSPDALWDESTLTLYVFFSRGNSGTSTFRRYIYDPASDRYVETSTPGGVKAPEQLRGGARVTIIKSPNGHLWAGVNSPNNQLLVSRSTDGGDTWPDPVVIKATAEKGDGHWVTFTAGQSTRVGFAATEDGAAPEARAHFIHLDQNEADWANPARWTDETSLLPGWEGDERADDELSAVTFENRVFVVIETEPKGDSRSLARPQLIVYERAATGGWSKHIIKRYTSSGGDDAKRPVITVEAASRQLVVSGGTTRLTHADIWYAPIDDLSGRDERWSRLRVFQVDDPETQNIYTTRMSLPRFPVTAESDLLLMIDDRGDARRMWRQVVRSAEPVNQAPVVDAGADQAIAAPTTSVNLHGSVSDDGLPNPPGATTHIWTQVSGPATISFGDPNALATTASGFTELGAYVLRLSADDSALGATDELTIHVATNQAPVVDAGMDQTVPSSVGAALAGTVNDDGLPTGSVLSHTWSVYSGPGTVSLADPSALSTTASFSTPGTYVLRLSASDGELSASDDVTITVNDGSSPTFRSASSAALTNAKGSILSIPTPVGVQPGDLLVAQIRYRSSTLGLSAPPGWTLLANIARSQANHAVLYKIATSAEPASYSFNQNTDRGRIAGGIGAYTGVNAQDPINAWAANTVDQGALVAPSVTTTVTNTLVLRLWGWRGASATEPGVGFNIVPTGITQRWSEQIGSARTDRNRVLAGDHVAANTGATGTVTAAGSVNTDENRRNAFTIALTPA